MRNRRGQPFLYAQVKSEGLYIQLTPDAKDALLRKIQRYDSGISRQEFFERLARGIINRDRFDQEFFDSL